MLIVSYKKVPKYFDFISLMPSVDNKKLSPFFLATYEISYSILSNVCKNQMMMSCKKDKYLVSSLLVKSGIPQQISPFTNVKGPAHFLCVNYEQMHTVFLGFCTAVSRAFLRPDFA